MKYIKNFIEKEKAQENCLKKQVALYDIFWNQRVLMECRSGRTPGMVMTTALNIPILLLNSGPMISLSPYHFPVACPRTVSRFPRAAEPNRNRQAGLQLPL